MIILITQRNKDERKRKRIGLSRDTNRDQVTFIILFVRFYGRTEWSPSPFQFCLSNSITNSNLFKNFENPTTLEVKCSILCKSFHLSCSQKSRDVMYLTSFIHLQNDHLFYMLYIRYGAYKSTCSGGYGTLCQRLDITRGWGTKLLALHTVSHR